MFGTNMAFLVGTLGREPDAVEFENNSEASNFTIATTDPFSKNTLWHRITAKGAIANLCNNNLTKGSVVSIVGHINNRSYIDNNTGMKVSITEIVAHRVDIISTPENAQGQQQGSNKGGYNNQDSYNNQGGYNNQDSYNNQGGYNNHGGQTLRSPYKNRNQQNNRGANREYQNSQNNGFGQQGFGYNNHGHGEDSNPSYRRTPARDSKWSSEANINDGKYHK